MRTVRRQVHALNSGKQSALAELMRAYAAEKQHWLQIFAQRDTRSLITRHRKVRDLAVAGQYQSIAGLQARMWKLALIDAAETWDKYWQSLFVDVRRKIGSHADFDEPMRHYAFWLLSGYRQFFPCLEGDSPAPKFKIALALLPKVAGFVRRCIAKLRGKPPSVKQARSVAFDADCYAVFTDGGTQYLKIMTLERGKRIVLPLSGHAAISGNIRVVADRDRLEVHVPQALVAKKQEDGAMTAVDFGYTEAMTDADGNASRGISAGVSWRLGSAFSL